MRDAGRSGIAAILVAALIAVLGACKVRDQPLAPTSNAVRAVGNTLGPGGTVLYVDRLAADHRIQYLEGAPGVRGILEVAKRRTRPTVTRAMQGQSFATVFRALHPSAVETPAALIDSDARAAAAAKHSGRFRQIATVSDGGQLPLQADTAGELQWFRDTFCDAQHTCSQQAGPIMLTTPSPAASYETTGLAPSEATIASSFIEYWWDCRSGTCWWNRLDRVSLDPGYYATMTAGYKDCPNGAQFASTIAGDPNAVYSLSMTYWLWIDC